MDRKKIIFIIIVILCGIWLMPVLYNRQDNSYYNIEYNGTIQANNKIIIQNSFSWQTIPFTTWSYHINHDIHIKENNNDIIKLFVIQQDNNWIKSNILQDYRADTTQWNHWLTVLTQEVFKKHKGTTLPWLSNISGLLYHIEQSAWLLVNTTTITGTYINQLWQKNNYDIIINSNCGLNQYINRKWKCNIYGKIWLDLPINNYTKERTIQWILHKSLI